jgi:voltage-gated potassium channel
MVKRQTTPLQAKFHEVIFGTETPAGKAFDVGLIAAILSSVFIVLLDSMPNLHAVHGALFWRIEWAFTIAFTLEYLVRIWCSSNRKAYILSGYGIVDLLSIMPTYIALIMPAAASLLVIRLLRMLRIFRILRLVAFLSEFNLLLDILRSSARGIFVFFSVVIILTIIFGCLMYVIEGPRSGFTNIPISIYWAIVTLTTVGYGDVVPVTWLGRAVSALGMLLGYAIIAVPTGIVTANFARHLNRQHHRTTRTCRQCARAGHEEDAHYCKFCGDMLPREDASHP